jgi:hypothetical protein
VPDRPAAELMLGELAAAGHATRAVSGRDAVWSRAQVLAG